MLAVVVVVVVVVISVLSSCGMIRSKKVSHPTIIAYLEAKQAIYTMCIGYWPPFFCRTFQLHEEAPVRWLLLLLLYSLSVLCSVLDHSSQAPISHMNLHQNESQ